MEHGLKREFSREEMADLVKALLEQVMKQVNPELDEVELSREESLDRLKTSRVNYEQKNDFKVGDIVVWKHHLKNRRFPKYGQLAIVMEVLKQPIYDDEKNSGSPRFREPLNIRLGIIDSYGEFEIFHYDKNRFTSYV